MKATTIFSLFAFLFAGIFLSTGCKKKKAEPAEFIIRVDSIHVADSTPASQTLDIEFFGTIGPNGCYSFDRFDGNFSGDSILITAIGVFSGDEVCPENIPLLDGAVLQVSNLIPGDYTVAVKQPDETYLTREITITQ